MALRVASINLNKRISNGRWHHQVLMWLDDNRVDLLLTQEPAKADPLVPDRLGAFVAVGGNSSVFTWQRGGAHSIKDLSKGEFWQALTFEGLTILNVYLDSGKPRDRAPQLEELNLVLATVTAPLVVVGDFNIAPEPEDGLYGGAPSKFNNETDRGSLRRLMDASGLVDKRSGTGRREYTVVRPQQGGLVQFRCDLALVSSSIEAQVELTYDHLVRDRSVGFTDHSALLLDFNTLE